jgi:hypothetical protein
LPADGFEALSFGPELIKPVCHSFLFRKRWQADWEGRELLKCDAIHGRTTHRLAIDELPKRWRNVLVDKKSRIYSLSIDANQSHAPAKTTFKREDGFEVAFEEGAGVAEVPFGVGRGDGEAVKRFVRIPTILLLLRQSGGYGDLDGQNL